MLITEKQYNNTIRRAELSNTRSAIDFTLISAFIPCQCNIGMYAVLPFCVCGQFLHWFSRRVDFRLDKNKMCSEIGERTHS